MILCLSGGVARADRQQLADGRRSAYVPDNAQTQLAEEHPCVREPYGMQTQLVGDRLFLMRDDGFGENALWLLTLDSKPVGRVTFAHMHPHSFRVVGDELEIIGSLPGEAPRVLVLDAHDLSLTAGETALGWPACSAPTPLPSTMKAVRSDATTFVFAHSGGPGPGRAFIAVMRDGVETAELDDDVLVQQNYASFCHEVYRSRPRRDEEFTCSAEDYARQRGSATFKWMAIADDHLITVSSAGVLIRDVDSLATVGAISTSALRAMSTTILLK